MARDEYNEKDLNPSPKRVEGEENYKDETADLGDSYGTLPKPPLKIETEDGERSDKAIENKKPQKLDNVLGVASARKMILPSRRDLVDPNGNPLIPTLPSGDGVKVWKGDFVGDETAFTKEMEEGDIIINDEGGIWLIKELAWDGDNPSGIRLQGFEDNNVPTTYTFDGSDWSDTELSVDTSDCAKVHSINEDMDMLAGWLNENASDLKCGDIIYSISEGAIGVIRDLSTGYVIAIQSVNADNVRIFIYTYDSGWSFENTEIYPLGTKLYKHTLSFSFTNASFSTDVDGISTPLYLITTSPSPITLNSIDVIDTGSPLSTDTGLISGENDDNYIIYNLHYVSDVSTLVANNNSLGQVIMWLGISNFTDTVTAL